MMCQATSLESRPEIFYSQQFWGGVVRLRTKEVVWLMLWKTKTTNAWGLCEMHSSVAWLQSGVQSPRQVIQKDHVSVGALKAIQHDSLDKIQKNFRHMKFGQKRGRQYAPLKKGTTWGRRDIAPQGRQVLCFRGKAMTSRGFLSTSKAWQPMTAVREWKQRNVHNILLFPCIHQHLEWSDCASKSFHKHVCMI